MDPVYSVGQTIFVVSKQQAKITSGVIIEQITKKTISSTETDYVVKLNDDSSTVIKLFDIKDEIFIDVEEIRRVLISRATTVIEELIRRAVNSVAQSGILQQVVKDDIVASEYAQVDMGNGHIAKVKIA